MKPANIRRSLCLPLVAAMVACMDEFPTEPDARAPSYDIADATTAYKSGFYWLRPMVAQPSYSGTFDAELSPVVEICKLEADACTTLVATYTMSEGPGGELVRMSLEDEHYHVNWHTNEFDLSTSELYRVSVRAGIYDVLLGYAEVQPVSNGGGLKNVDTGEYIGLVDGRTLPIKFRIETGIVGSVEVRPIEATAEEGGTQQFIAILYDLHGNIMNDDVSWASSDENVATVDQTGLASAIDDGVTTITATSERMKGSATLTVEGGVVIVISTGEDHSCTVDENGRAYCWGRGDLGQIGNGSTANQLRPVAVAAGLTFTRIEAGRFHNCALTADGQAYCWGYNFSGQIGNGSGPNNICAINQPCRLTPTEVLGGIVFTSLSAGTRNTCALTSDNRAYCWGEAAFGALGNGTQVDARTPQPVSGGHAFVTISTGLDAACAVTTDGQGYCWGAGGSGMLGNGSTATRLTPFPVAGGLTFTSIKVGSVHTCGLTMTGQAYCWGSGAFGKLGNGLLANQLTPVPVSGGLIFASISPGSGHTCGVTTTGQGYCWGSGGDGQLGIGVSAIRTTPVLVMGGHTWASIETGTSHTCGVTVENRRYCWGRGNSGQLGTGSPANRGTPVLVAALP